jgi:hypothetical protein|tara:strand:+ start:393 stop:512 length:120 start_codon:yes stop_codon:yes gene_type:complete
MKKTSSKEKKGKIFIYEKVSQKSKKTQKKIQTSGESQHT